jgi:hypothetical protein
VRRRDWFLLGAGVAAAAFAYLWDETKREARERGHYYDWIPRCPTCDHSMALHGKDGGCHAEVYVQNEEGHLVGRIPCRCPHVSP